MRTFRTLFKTLPFTYLSLNKRVSASYANEKIDQNGQDHDFFVQRAQTEVDLGIGSKLYLGVVKGDITCEKTDYIVNAANSHLKHGGGVAGAIRVKGGSQIQASSDKYIQKHGPVKTGTCAKILVKGNLPCNKGIIHAVGPIWNGGFNDEPQLLADCFRNSLLAASDGVSVAIPPISSGIFGFPKELCAKIFFEEFKKFSQMDKQAVGSLRFVFVVINNDETLNIFMEEFRKSFFQSST